MRNCFLVFCSLIIAFLNRPLAAQVPNSGDTQPQASARRDGSHDFDFEDGNWKIHLKRRLHPLTGSKQWIEFDGTSTTQRLWDGAAHLEQFETSGAGGHVEGLTYRLYRPEARQWYIY